MTSATDYLIKEKYIHLLKSISRGVHDIRELSRLEKMDYPYLSTVMSKFVEFGIVIKTKDGRRSTISLTDNGEEILGAAIILEKTIKR